ncbi:2Fe-2S iron-sulfur cluster-binding protein [Acrocarpospora macrocephala]|nr:2Fe-2S iron-sulfur cluster-binding protein [Acrocarpospora macrocephala]
MPWVTVEPSGVRFEVREGESVAEAAWRQGYVWPTKCWGQADCMSCFTKIVDGELSAVPAGTEELDAMRLKMVARVRGPMVRLACRLTVKKDGLVLHKQGVRVPEDVPNSNQAITG